MNMKLYLIAILIAYILWLNSNCYENCLLIALFELCCQVNLSVKGVDRLLER